MHRGSSIKSPLCWRSLIALSALKSSPITITLAEFRSQDILRERARHPMLLTQLRAGEMSRLAFSARKQAQHRLVSCFDRFSSEIHHPLHIIVHRRRSFSTRSVVVGTPLKSYYILPAMSASQELILGTYLDVIWACHAVWCAVLVYLRRLDCSERSQP